MLAMQKFIPLILPVDKKYLIIFLIGLSLNIIFYKAKFIYYFIVDNRAIKKIDHI